MVTLLLLEAHLDPAQKLQRAVLWLHLALLGGAFISSMDVGAAFQWLQPVCRAFCLPPVRNTKLKDDLQRASVFLMGSLIH